MKKRVIVVLTIVVLIGVIYWFFRFEIKNYFFSKHAVFWSENVELRPADFQAKVDYNSSSKIIWFHGLYLFSTNLKDAEVKAVFDKNQSWIKDTVNFKENMKLQKLVFDLHESYARKFNKEINKIKFENNKSFSDLRIIGDKIYSELEIMKDSIYNSDLNQNALLKIWRPKINKMLKAKN